MSFPTPEPETIPPAELLRALQALERGEFDARLDGDYTGTAAEIAATVNGMAERFRVMSSELRRLARECGPEARYGGQTEVEGLAGEWQALNDDFNRMSAVLTDRIRDVSLTITAIANGNFCRKVTVGCDGELEELKLTMNVMIDQLNAFAYEVTRLSREIGNEGKLGGQAHVPGAAGTWLDLIDNLNHMSTRAARRSGQTG